MNGNRLLAIAIGLSFQAGAATLTYTQVADAPAGNVIVSQTSSDAAWMTIKTNTNDGVDDENMYGQTFLSPSDFDLSAVSFKTVGSWNYDPGQEAQLALLEDTDSDTIPDTLVGDVYSVNFPNSSGDNPWKTFTLSDPVACSAGKTYAFVFTLMGPVSDGLRVLRDRTQIYSDGHMISTTYPAGDFPALPIELKTDSDMLFVIQAVGSPEPVLWSSNPVVEADADEGVGYAATLSDNVSVLAGNNPTFTKQSGPSWLNVASNGALSGTPAHADIGLNSFAVQVSANGSNETATLEITVPSPVVEWDMESRWGISESGFDSAITAAHNHFSSRPNDTIIVHIAAGTHDISGTIDLRTGYLLDPGDKGRLIFQGAGMDETTLVFSNTTATQINGRNVAHITFRDMHFTRGQYTVSQGTVVEVGSDYVDLEIHEGFPTPHDIVDWPSPQGLYLRRYTPSKTDPLIITDGKNGQVRWETNSYALATNAQNIVTWRMLTGFNSNELVNYKLGEYVGIKSKHTGNNWFFTGSDDLVFENNKYTHDSRGVFRQGTSNVHFSGCRFERAAPINGQTPCLMAPGGGPQFGQPLPDAVSTNMVIENCYIESTGDDCTAFFHVNGGMVSNCVFRDSFARGILLQEDSSNIVFMDTLVSRGPIQQDNLPIETVPPAQPTGLSLVDRSDHCELSWNPNVEGDLHYYQIYRKLDGVWWEYAITTDTFYDDLWAENGIIHEYYLEAVDFSGNHSDPTQVISAPPDYTIWTAGYSLSGSNALATADLEPDGLNNYMEYVLGGNPAIADASAVQPGFSVISDSGADWMEYVCRRRNDYVSRGMGYTVESSTNLFSNVWNTNDVVEVGSIDIDGEFEAVTNRLSIQGRIQQFIRLRVD